MSQAKDNFDIAIQDAERILDAYDKLNRDRSDNRDPEELKRAALIMSLTAWETYVEDRISEELHKQMKSLEGSQVAKFVKNTLEEELKYFHNPNSAKTKRLFERFLFVDVTEGWNWASFDPKMASTRLNEWIKKRGDAVHRSVMDKQAGHLVSREDMRKCVNFFKCLVEATDKTLAIG
jgi:hypothetical protein